MKKILLAFLIVAGGIGSSKAQNPDFRAFGWGTSISQVQFGESTALIAKVGDDELLYKDNLGGYDCNVVYIFNDNNSLESGMYIFSKKYSNPQLYLEDYKTFKALLITKYGKAVSDNEIWDKNTPVQDKTNYGQAVADGKLSLNAVWNTPRSTIKITLLTADNHPSLQIYYTALSLDELQNKDVINKALIKL